MGFFEKRKEERSWKQKFEESQAQNLFLRQSEADLQSLVEKMQASDLKKSNWLAERDALLQQTTKEKEGLVAERQGFLLNERRKLRAREENIVILEAELAQKKRDLAATTRGEFVVIVQKERKAHQKCLKQWKEFAEQWRVKAEECMEKLIALQERQELIKGELQAQAEAQQAQEKPVPVEASKPKPAASEQQAISPSDLVVM